MLRATFGRRWAKSPKANSMRNLARGEVCGCDRLANQKAFGGRIILKPIIEGKSRSFLLKTETKEANESRSVYYAIHEQMRGLYMKELLSYYEGKTNPQGKKETEFEGNEERREREEIAQWYVTEALADPEEFVFQLNKIISEFTIPDEGKSSLESPIPPGFPELVQKHKVQSPISHLPGPTLTFHDSRNPDEILADKQKAYNLTQGVLNLDTKGTRRNDIESRQIEESLIHLESRVNSETGVAEQRRYSAEEYEEASAMEELYGGHKSPEMFDSISEKD